MTGESSIPIDVSRDLEEAGAIACHRVEDMIERLAELARKKSLKEDTP
jgi:hypothetical protein